MIGARWGGGGGGGRSAVNNRGYGVNENRQQTGLDHPNGLSMRQEARVAVWGL